MFSFPNVLSVLYSFPVSSTWQEYVSCISSGSSETVGDMFVRTERTIEVGVEEGLGWGIAGVVRLGWIAGVVRLAFSRDRFGVQYYS